MSNKTDNSMQQASEIEPTNMEDMFVAKFVDVKAFLDAVKIFQGYLTCDTISLIIDGHGIRSLPEMDHTRVTMCRVQFPPISLFSYSPPQRPMLAKFDLGSLIAECKKIPKGECLTLTPESTKLSACSDELSKTIMVPFGTRTPVVSKLKFAVKGKMPSSFSFNCLEISENDEFAPEPCLGNFPRYSFKTAIEEIDTLLSRAASAEEMQIGVSGEGISFKASLPDDKDDINVSFDKRNPVIISLHRIDPVDTPKDAATVGLSQSVEEEKTTGAQSDDSIPSTVGKPEVAEPTTVGTNTRSNFISSRFAVDRLRDITSRFKHVAKYVDFEVGEDIPMTATANAPRGGEIKIWLAPRRPSE